MYRFLLPWGATVERQQFDIKLPLEALALIFYLVYLLMSFPQGDTSARQQWFGISFSFPRWASKRLLRLICLFAIYTAGHSAITSGLRFRLSH